MNAREKKNYCSGLFHSMLEPYGFFIRHGELWKCSLEGKYLINISFELSRWGDLNQIYISWSSFYAPIDIVGKKSKSLCMNNFIMFAFYLRAIGYHSILCKIGESFEEQIQSIIPHFERIIIPILPSGNSLDEFISFAAKLSHMWQEISFSAPLARTPEEMCYSYFSLNDQKAAIDSLNQYILECNAFIEIARTQQEGKYGIFNVQAWQRQVEKAQLLLGRIQSDDIQSLYEEAETIFQYSRNNCKSYFHLK